MNVYTVDKMDDYTTSTGDINPTSNASIIITDSKHFSPRIGAFSPRIGAVYKINDNGPFLYLGLGDETKNDPEKQNHVFYRLDLLEDWGNSTPKELEKKAKEIYHLYISELESGELKSDELKYAVVLSSDGLEEMGPFEEVKDTSNSKE